MARAMKDSGIEWLGDIPADWELSKIKHNFTVYSGATPKSEFAANWDGNIIWITPADYKTTDRYVSQGKRNISATGYNSCGTTLVPKGSIIFSKRAPIGTVAIAAVELCTNQGCLSCVPKADTDSGYYCYVMSAFTEQFNLYGTGTTFKEISYDVFCAFKIPRPPLDEQQRIAAFLDGECARIDSVVEKTRASIEEYRKLKQAIITRAVTKGIRPNRPTKDSGIDWLGDIPADWEVIKLKYLFSIIGGNGFPDILQGNAEGDYPFCKVSDINGEADYVDTASNWVTQAVVDNNRFNVVPTGSIIMAKIGAALAKNHRKINLIKCCIDNNTQALVPKRDDCTRYLLQLSKCIDMSWFDNKSTVPSINNPKLLNFFVPNVPLDEQKEIAAYLDEKTATIDSLVAKKNRLVSELESLKKSLIFEYVTGKKEVPT